MAVRYVENLIRSLAMTAMFTLEPSDIRTLPGERLLLLRVIMGRKVATLIEAELDRRALMATLPEVQIGERVKSKSAGRRRKAA